MAEQGLIESAKLLLLQERVKQLEKDKRLLMQQLEAVQGLKETRREILANVSHELRTPLNGILGMANLLKSTGVNTEQREYVDSITKCGSDLLGVLNDLVTLADAKFGRTTPEKRSFRLRETLEPLFDDFRRDARTRRLSFQATVLPEVPDKLEGDPEGVKTVLRKVVGNAIKFTHEGGVTVEVANWEHESELKSGADQRFFAMLLFMVYDSGKGIPKTCRQSIFETFSLGEGVYTKERSGAGLGLPIARHLVQEMGGRLWLERSGESGSQFCFTFLFHKSSPGAALSGADCCLLGDEARQEILYIDADEISALYTRTLLKKMGYRVTWLIDGNAALKRLQNEYFDLVMLDLELPRRNGRELIQDIRSSVENLHPDLESGAPIVALSESPRYRERSTDDAGADELLAKPVDRERLQRAIDKALAKYSRNPAI